MKEKQHIYTITCLKKDMESRSCFLILSSEEEAVKAVLENKGDLFEYYYDYCVIEKYPVDSLAIPSRDFSIWFKLIEYKENKAVVERCEKPHYFSEYNRFALN